MIEKKTTNRGYPKPDADNFLQDDVKNIENAMDLIDKDVYDLTQEQAEQNTTIDTKADKSWAESEVATLKDTKADKTDVEQKYQDTTQSIADTKLAIESKIEIESLLEFSI